MENTSTPNVPAVIDDALPTTPISRDMVSANDDTFTSWPVVTPEDKELYFRARHNEAKDLSDIGDRELLLTNVLAHNVERDDRNGDGPEKFTRIALIEENGDVWESYSKGIKETVKSLLFMVGAGPWSPPIRCKVRRIKGSQPSPLQKLEYLGRAPGGKKDAKAK